MSGLVSEEPGKIKMVNG